MIENQENIKARLIVDKMYQNDAFSKWLGIVVEEVFPGKVKLSMQVREEFTNGFKVAHGGIAYALADSALAFASNGYGRHALSIETSISHTRPVMSGEKLIAITEELSSSRSLAIYHVTITNERQESVAFFKGTVFKKDKTWELK